MPGMRPSIGDGRAPDDEVLCAGVAVAAEATRAVVVWQDGESQSMDEVGGKPGGHGVTGWIGLPEMGALSVAADAVEAPSLAFVKGPTGGPDVGDVGGLTDAAAVGKVAPKLFGPDAL